MAFQSLRSRILLVAVVVLTLFSVTTAYFAHCAKRELLGVVQENALDLLKATEYHVASEHDSILFHKSAMLTRRKAEVQDSVDIAFSTIQTYWQEAREGKISEEDAKARLITLIRNMRYGNGSGYFWVMNDVHPLPTMIMHPIQPELNGTILDGPIYDCALGTDENLTKAMVEICKRQGEGYVDYLWPKPTPEGLEQRQSKISYVKRFEPWGWIIGTGLYVDDIDQDVENRIDAVITELNKTIVKQKIGQSGDFFIFNNDNEVLVSSDRIDREVVWMNPETGELLLNDLKKAASVPFRSMDYHWQDGGNSNSPVREKIAFVTYYEPLGWYIASTVLKDDFELIVNNLTGSILNYSGITIGIVLALALLISRSITRPLQVLSHSISRTDADGIPMDQVPVEGIHEIRNLSATINNMIESIYHFRKDILARNAELEEFTYIASHDLQEPLRKLMVFCGLLEKDIGGDLPANARKDIEFIQDAARRMQALIQDLLALSRAGNREMKCQKVALEDCVSHAIGVLEIKLVESGTILTRDSLPVIAGDPTMMTLLYQNLMDNAIKYRDTDRMSEIHLTARENAEEFILGVHDNGIGIKPEHQEQIFSPFKRLHGREQYEGSGIGLSICRKVVDRHHGRIWVESTPGEGSHFFFAIPRKLSPSCTCPESNNQTQAEQEVTINA